MVIRHVYHAPITVDFNQLALFEDWDMALVKPDDIRRGSCYSEKARQVQPLGHPHQKILLDFIAADFSCCQITG